MGKTYCYTLDFNFSNSDYIDVAGIIVNILLTIWIVTVIQNRSANKRVLKDHYINELKEIRNEFKTCLSNLYNDKVNPKNILPWFKLMNIKITDFIEEANSTYKIDKNILNPYQNELRELITENSDFISQFNLNQKLVLSVKSKNELMQFQQKHSKIFNQLIIKINNY
jgi:hypothetical protein